MHSCGVATIQKTKFNQIQKAYKGKEKILANFLQIFYNKIMKKSYQQFSIFLLDSKNEKRIILSVGNHDRKYAQNVFILNLGKEPFESGVTARPRHTSVKGFFLWSRKNQ